ncbi:metal ABC transporter solute-binding protein, Zn/Mn family [Cytobacillus horneckiae]|uniref:Adhesin n=1 Tax=Cytobacillus horneckiae TaxID=549687 RepID=A0A2N0ZNB7_9BACI|nr:zinc ABC transporter substrate-binding protein [Cytobacillus horneckiae]MEC1154885.1 zinc ABC transporter substrate-binding protein [Cytobacillus horneckiae]MED2936209.1 zinc ABC transporter substrate-binding protein [Cytobacillus horneckiae]PKG31002.1 adhesin [Cytobacillus horneckiae]
MKKILLLLIPFIMVMAACASPTAEEQNNEEKLTVYSTVYPLQYFTERIGGELVDVKTIYPPGADEHTFEPSQKEMIAIADADLFIYLGLGLEGFVDNAKNTLKNENVTMIPAGENIHLEEAKTEDEHEGHSHEEHGEEEHDHDHAHGEDGHEHHHHGDVDPHVWIDPLYSKELAESIKNALIDKMPEEEKTLNANYEKLAAELDELNNEFTKVTNEAKNKKFIVSHAAFGYWEERYGLEQISISGLSTSSEPSQKELQKIIDDAKEHNLDYIFFEQNVSSKLTEIIQTEIGAEPLTIHNLSVLTQEDIDNEENYFTLMNKNIENLNKALN